MELNDIDRPGCQSLDERPGQLRGIDKIHVYEWLALFRLRELFSHYHMAEMLPRLPSYQPLTPCTIRNMSTESNKRKDAPDTAADLPVCKRFCVENADIVLKSTKRVLDWEKGVADQPAMLFRVHSEDLKRMSVVFRDMLTLGAEMQSAASDVIELPEDTWVLRNLLLLNSSDIEDQPDIHDYQVLSLLRLHEAGRCEVRNDRYTEYARI